MHHSLVLSRHLLLALLTVSVVSGCASIQQAVDKVRGEEAPAPDAAEPKPTPDATPAQVPAPPAPKPATRTKPPAPEPARPVPAPAPRPAEPAPQAVPGPEWLKKCQSVQLAGGIVRCDADLLLAKPSPTVQVFTRDPERAVDGQIRLRQGLPRVYRFYVVP